MRLIRLYHFFVCMQMKNALWPIISAHWFVRMLSFSSTVEPFWTRIQAMVHRISESHSLNLIPKYSFLLLEIWTTLPFLQIEEIISDAITQLNKLLKKRFNLLCPFLGPLVFLEIL